ncbi:MAG: GlsB/YeaQ/YmgE family stress response membrane protein [Gemmataceae bacterium]|nr:GlsB/YeaQ/YmgE family stress response membrane protein [Gemmataceae bacterium]
MDPISFLYFILIGLAAGWLAGIIMKSPGGGLLRNLIIGTIGALLGGFLSQLVGIHASGLLGSLLVATAGAVVLILLLRVLSRPPA